MATGIESDRLLGPVVHRMRRWVRNVASRVSNNLSPEDRRNLDPITVNYAAWREMRRHVREWPGYWEAPNHLEVLVSPEDWEDYWGIDAARKEQAVAVYVRARAAEKGYWIAGQPQVKVISDEALAAGEVEVECQFVASPDGAPPRPATQLSSQADQISSGPATARHPETPGPFGPGRARYVIPAAGERARDDGAYGPGPQVSGTRAQDGVEQGPSTMEFSSAEATVRFVDAADAGEVLLLGKDGLSLTLRSGDCVGAIAPEDDVPPEVTVRLSAREFPYAEAKHFSIGVVGGRWSVVNHASTGTKVLPREGGRLMLRQPEPFPLSAGDVVYLGPYGPLRFEFV